MPQRARGCPGNRLPFHLGPGASARRAEMPGVYDMSGAGELLEQFKRLHEQESDVLNRVVAAQRMGDVALAMRLMKDMEAVHGEKMKVYTEMQKHRLDKPAVSLEVD